MITVEQYFSAYPRHPDIKPAYLSSAKLLLDRVNHLLGVYGHTVPLNPATLSQISGNGNGGWRPQECPIGAPKSSHKTGEGVDVYDPNGELDDWIASNEAMLVAVDLYVEDPGSTRGWCHLTTRAPRSGKRSFYP